MAYYNLRSNQDDETEPIKEEFQDNQSEREEKDINNGYDPSCNGNSGHSSDFDDNASSSLIDSANPSPATSVSSSTAESFPCKLCGKVFSKVKSRSAHMKIHGSGAAKY